MDDERQAGDARDAAMWRRKTGLLRVLGRVVVEVVEPGLADGDAAGMLAEADQVLGEDVQFLVGVVRMGADRAPDLGVLPRRWP